MTLQALLDDIKAQDWSDQDKQTAALLIADLHVLTLQQLQGVDITSELVHVRAQALNLAAENQQRVLLAFEAWTANLVAGLIASVLAS
ncbi:MAG TPA: hypothetical protein VM537_01545 [Anaerolineae bacterium]|nr:hypothetical protein [Anaerolineae bacterium]